MAKQNNWYASSIETPTTPLMDSSSGRPMVLEIFEFAVKPQVIDIPIPTKQQLFNQHWPHIKALIWAKGLIANTDVEPRIVIGKKRYRIFVLCEPRFNKHGIKVIQGKPKNLQDVLKDLTKP